MDPEANVQNSKEIKQGMNNLVNNFTSSNPTLPKAPNGSQMTFSNASEFAEKLSQESFIADNKNGAAGKASDEMTQNLKKIVKYMTENGKNDAKLDYQSWRDNVTGPARGLTGALDAFNELTNYEFANSWPMRLLKNIVNLVNGLDMDTQKRELAQTPVADTQVKTEEVKEKIEESADAVDQFKEFCKEKFIGPNTAVEAGNVLKNIQSISLDKVEKEKADIATYEGHLNQAMGNNDVFAKNRFFESVWAHREKQLITADLQTQTAEKEKAVKDMLAGGTLSPAMKKDLSTRMDLVDFMKRNPLKPDEKSFAAFKENFIKENPCKLNVKGYEKLNTEQMRGLLGDWVAINDGKLKSHQKTKPEAMKLFADYMESDKKLIAAQKEQKVAAEFVEKQKAFYRGADVNKSPEWKERFFKANIEDAEKITDLNLIRKGQRVSRQKYEEQILKNPDAKQISDIIKAKKDFVTYCGSVANKMEPIKKRIAPVIKARNFFEETVNRAKHSEFAKNAKHSLNRMNEMEEGMKAGLDRFSEQMDKCKRRGHIDTKEFRTLRTALDAARKNMTPANLTVLKTAADEYLEKKGTSNRLGSQMRQHRLDLAQSISAFAGQCKEPAQLLQEHKPAAVKLNQQIQKLEQINPNKEIAKIEGSVNQSINSDFRKEFQALHNEVQNKRQLVDGLENAFIQKMTQKQKEKAAENTVVDINAPYKPENPVIKAPEIKAPAVNAPQMGGLS